MTIHLIRSEEYPKQDYVDLIRFLEKSGHAIHFLPDEDPVSWADDELQQLLWEDEESPTKQP